MAQKILFLLILSTFTVAAQQVEVGYSNDFESSTTEGWVNGGASPNPPIVIEDDGPNGAGDAYLLEYSSGGAGAGSRWVIFNRATTHNLGGAGWQDDFIAAGVKNISMFARYEVPSGFSSGGFADLHLRIGFQGGSGNTRIVTTASKLIPVTDTNWQEVVFSILPSDFTVVSGANTVEEVLSDVFEMRIISNPDISFFGQALEIGGAIDKITALGELSIPEFVATQIKVFPNPFTNTLNISASRGLKSYSVYNILGAKIASGTLNGLKASVPLGNLTSGIYLLEVKTDSNELLTRKIIKQ